MRVICDQCGKETKKRPAAIKRTKHNFCSKSCAGLFRRTGVKVICEQCGKDFEKSLICIKRTKHNLCSPKCWGLFNRGKNNHMYGKHHSEKARRKMSEAGKGRHCSEETRRRISEATKGRRCSEETRRRMSEASKGRRHSEETRRRMSEAKRGKKNSNYGKSRSEETRRKISEANKGKRFSEETRRRMSEAGKRKHFSDEHRRKISEAGKGRYVSEETRQKRRGENNPNWRGGISFEPYPPDFNDLLKRKIRKRDSFVCQYCGSQGWCVHHIDYNKKNNHDSNLITLCKSCHCKTNYNRVFWESLFKSRRSFGDKIEMTCVD